MDNRLSYMQSVEDSYPNELAASINPCVNLKDDFAEADLVPNHLKVYLRIRPLLPDEQSEDENIKILNDQTISMVAASHAHSHKDNTKVSHNFSFSHVYGMNSSQKIIFDQTTSELVKDIVNGQNCLMFTYGATNSGKTFTIQGTEKEPGLLPRTLLTLFESVGHRQYQKDDLTPHHFCSVVRLSDSEIRREREIKDAILKSKDFSRVSTCSNFSYVSCSSKDLAEHSLASADSTSGTDILDGTCASDTASSCYAIFVSFAEIYNEFVYDLLENITHRNVKRTPLILGEDRVGSIYIKGLQHIKVSSAEEALQVMEVGRQNLHFASTQLNQNSSRSHCIFTIRLVHLFDPRKPHMANTSMLSLCDLAGAEKATKTMNDNFRLKEASNINTSLLVLGRCIAALRHNQTAKHSLGNKRAVPVPYRDSKVTRLFQSFFMGKGFLAMIVNICTSTILVDDTLKVLKFSAIARKVAIVPSKAYIDNHVENQRQRSRFSRFMRQSLNMTKTSIRFSTPWANSTAANVTFGAVDEEEEEAETTKDDSCYGDGESHTQILLDLIKQLRDRLVRLTKEKQDMEKNLRKEICDSFSQRLVEIQNSYTRRIEEERFRTEELMDWRVNRALETTDLALSSRKRQRLEEDGGVRKRVSVLTLFQEESKMQEITEERDLLLDELSAVKATLKSALQNGQSLQEKNSNLTFKLSVMSESLEEADRDKEKMESALKDALAGSLDSESAVNEELKQSIRDLTNERENITQENNTVKLMLTEAAEEFIDKEQQLASVQETLTQQNVILSDLENQLFEAKEMIASQVTRIEEREKSLAELQEELVQLKMSVEADGLQGTTMQQKPHQPKCAPRNRTNLLRYQCKNQSLIEFENSENKIYSQQETEQTNKFKYLEESLSKSEEKCLDLRKELKTYVDKELSLLTQLEAKDKELQGFKDLQTRVDSLQFANEELATDNATLKFVIDNDVKANEAKPGLDELSLSLINNEELSRCGEAPADAENGNLEEIEDLRLVLESLNLKSVQELEQNLLDCRSQLESTTKKLNETDEELVTMCKLSESLQEEVLVNRNRINFLESDLYGVRKKCESSLREFEVSKMAYEKLSQELNTYKETYSENEELKLNLSQLKEMNSKFATDAVTAKEIEIKLMSQIEHYMLQLKELANLQTQVQEFEQNKIAVDEEHAKLKQQLQSFEESSLEKANVVDNLTKKVESLDKKLSDSENSTESKTRENELLSKQLAAIVEARKEELVKFEQERDSEIASLQKELKELIAGTKKNAAASGVKQEETDVRLAEEQLKQSELERSNLTSYITDLEKQLADKAESYKQLELELSSFSRKSVSTLESIDQPERFEEFITPVPRARSTRGRGVSKHGAMDCTEVEGELGESKNRSTRSKRQTVTFSDSLETPSGLQGRLEGSSEEAPAVETSTRRSTRKTRGRGKKNNTVHNPHIPDEKDKENQAADVTTENKRSTRRRRPLYNVADEQTLDGSPNLLPADQLRSCPEESPHTISRRLLRSKFK